MQTIKNKELSDFLGLIAGYYKQSKDEYRYKTFERASENIKNYTTDIQSGEYARRNIKGIGKSVEKEIDEFLNTGTSDRFIELEKEYSDRKKIIDNFLNVYGIGVALANQLYDKGYRSLSDITAYEKLNRAQKLGLIYYDGLSKKIPRSIIDDIYSRFKSILDKYDIEFEFVGSYRRGLDYSGDIDMIVLENDYTNIAGILVLLDEYIEADLSGGNKKYSGILKGQYRIDIRMADIDTYWYMLLYFTGGKNLNIMMRKKAASLGYILNEYGLFDQNGNRMKVHSEKEIFDHLDIDYLPPNQRSF